MALTRSEMDRKLDEHFRFEADDHVEGVLATLTDDVEHDVVGWPTGASRGREGARPLYEALFADLADGKVRTLRRLYGDEYWTKFAALEPKAFDSYVQQFDRMVNGQDKVIHTAQYSGYLEFKAKGAPVEFVYQTVKVGTKRDTVYVEAHKDIYKVGGSAVGDAMTELRKRGYAANVDRKSVKTAVEGSHGMPFRVGESRRPSAT